MSHVRTPPARRRRPGRVLGALLLPTLALVLAVPGARAQEEPAEGPTRAEIQGWVVQLASKSEEEVAAAREALIVAGEAARGPVEAELAKRGGTALEPRYREVLDALTTGRWAALLTPARPLPQAHDGVPPVLSPDGAHVLYIERERDAEGNRSFHYGVAEVTDEKLVGRRLFATAVGRDDFLVNQLRPGTWHPDGRRFGVLTADPQSERGMGFRAGIGSVDGDLRLLPPAERLVTHDLCFDVDGRVAYYLETTGYSQQANPGYTLWALDLETDEARAVQRVEGALAIDLNPSPVGGQLAFLRVTLTSRQVEVVVVDLASGETLAGPSYRGDDYFYDGPPLHYWTPDGASVVFQGEVPASREDHVYVLDAETGRTRSFLPAQRLGISGMLDARHACVMLRGQERKPAVLDLESGAITPLSGTVYLVQRVGERSVLYVDEGEREGVALNGS